MAETDLVAEVELLRGSRENLLRQLAALQRQKLQADEALEKTKANMEEAERSLYLKIDALEDENADLRAALKEAAETVYETAQALQAALKRKTC